MRKLLAPAVLIGCVVLGWQIGGADRFGRGSIEAREAERLVAHFARVEQELLARDVSALTPKQQAARAEQIRRLRGYAEAGEFPRNDFHPGTRVPYFRDARGTLCAMAFLIAASGRGDIVDHIARTRNYAYLPELVDVPGLAGWLEDNGLTVAEAARIQPAYDGWPCLGCGPDEPVKKPSSRYLGASALTTGLSGVSIALNARSADRRSSGPWSGVLGLGAGAASVVLGAVRIGEPGWENGAVVAWNLGVGAAATILGVRALSQHPSPERAAARRLRIVPTALANDRPAIGFQGNFRF